jgi:hypothetical protein
LVLEFGKKDLWLWGAIFAVLQAFLKGVLKKVRVF